MVSPSVGRALGQFAAYGVFAVIVGVFSVWPEYRHLNDQQAIISLTFSHAAERMETCRRRSQDELNELPPNMRKPDECPRERHTSTIELRANGELLYSETLFPSGIWKDGKANVYNRTIVDAGDYSLFIGMNDSGGGEGFDYEHRESLHIMPGQNIVISFDSLNKQFVFD